MTQEFKATIVFCTLRTAHQSIKTIYHLDMLVARAAETGEHTVLINEPSEEILHQIYSLRPQYETVFRVA